MKVSNCCRALPYGETYKDMGFCSECMEHAVFEGGDDEVDPRIHNHPLGIGFAQKDRKENKK